MKIENLVLNKNLKLKIKNYTHRPLIRAVVYLLIPAVCLYVFGKSLAADYFFQKARGEINTDNGQTAYKDLQTAISLSPDNDTYHRAYAQINLAVAGSIGSTPEGLGLPNPSGAPAEVKDKVTRLIQQAVREAKLAVTLNGSDWENAATAGRIYQTVASVIPSLSTTLEINSVEGSSGNSNTPDSSTKFTSSAAEMVGITPANWAVKYLEMAVKLDPYNPVRHLDLGGYYYSQAGAEGDSRQSWPLTPGVTEPRSPRAASPMDKALEGALKAVELKSNFANAHYSLAAVYRVKGEMEKVKAELKETIKSLPKDSPYAAGIRQELQSLDSPQGK